jgi:hypothetical protein
VQVLSNSLLELKTLCPGKRGDAGKLQFSESIHKRKKPVQVNSLLVDRLLESCSPDAPASPAISDSAEVFSLEPGLSATQNALSKVSRVPSASHTELNDLTIFPRTP